MPNVILKKPVLPEPLPKACVTERKWMSYRGNAFDLITIMAENDSKAFELLVDIMGNFGDATLDAFAKRIDDMNIRGEQITLLWKSQPFEDLAVFMLYIRTDPAHAVDYVNGHWPKAFMEEATLEGAHKYAHKKIIAAPI